MTLFKTIDQILHSDVFLAFAGFAALMALVYAALVVKRPETEPDPQAFWRRARAGLGLEALPMPVFYAAAALWGLLFLSLFSGLFLLIWRVILHAVPDSGPDSGTVWNYRFLLAQLVATTTVLGAVVALPFTILGIKINRATQKTTADALFNDKVNAALADLHAQRQVTEWKRGQGHVTVWQDDVVRRNGAIDRLFALAQENPDTAPRLARVLTNYLRELSREFPPEKPPKDTEPEALRIWAQDLKPARPDMENAAQTLGRFLTIPGLTPETLDIDLHGANLQGMELGRLEFRRANFNGAHLEGAYLGGAQLEGASLIGAHLERVFFEGAHLERASLIGAHLEGAGLGGAHLEGAYLGGAQLEGAYLREAHLEGAYLDGAHLEGAGLQGAHLERARLFRAHLEGAYLGGADLEGADLGEAHLDQSTDFSDADTSLAALKSVDLGNVPISAAQVQSMFGDGSVTLPEGLPPPTHWPEDDLDISDFFEEWDLYKSDPAAYVPPQAR